MHKTCLLAFTMFLLIGGVSMAGSAEDVKFRGVASEVLAGETPEAPSVWTVDVTEDLMGNLCSDVIRITVFQSNATVGGKVEVYGTYVPDSCIKVTLEGSKEYYFLPINSGGSNL